MLTPQIAESYLAILDEELIPAMGCTEPIALAYAAADGQRQCAVQHLLMEGELPPVIAASLF